MGRSIQQLTDMGGRTVVVTGGAGHVGRVAAEAYLEVGADVILLDRDEAGLTSVRDELAGFGGTCEIEAVDLGDERARSAAIGAVAATTGRLDVLVNCAAFVGADDLPGWAVPFEEQSMEAWRRAMEVNLTAAFHLVQLAAPHLRHAPAGGAVLNIASIYGMVAPDLSLYEGTDMANPAAYAVSKGGLVQLTRWLATVLAPSVRVNAIAPGGLKRNQPEAFIARYRERTPLGRMGREEDLKGALVYLASDLSAYVTGQVLAVDGGWTAW